MIRRGVARLYWRMSRWNYRADQLPDAGVGILIGAPHTSNWDFVLMLAVTWRAGISAKFLGKHSLFRGPAGPIMRGLGGIPVDRSNPVGIVDDIVAHTKAGERFFLVVTPEGTRGGAAYWKSGFYRMAVEADLPITLGFVDRTTMTAGVGPTFWPSGDVSADMTWIRTFYADKAGFAPTRRVEPRLRAEDVP